MNKIEIIFWKIAKWIIRNGYGTDCETAYKGCPSCDAKKTIDWIDDHIKLLKL